jgi:hypothetical protein
MPWESPTVILIDDFADIQSQYDVRVPRRTRKLVLRGTYAHIVPIRDLTRCHFEDGHALDIVIPFYKPSWTKSLCGLLRHEEASLGAALATLALRACAARPHHLGRHGGGRTDVRAVAIGQVGGLD